jgi:tetratricopeptide (TPR) repeat protein
MAIGRELLDLAEQEQDPSLEVEGHLTVGPSMAFMGAVEEGLRHLDRAIELFDPARDGRAPFRLGPSPGVAALVVSAILHWLSGHPDTAARKADSALELATRLDHPYSLAYATFHVTMLDVWNRRLDVAYERAGQALKLAEEHDYAIWKAVGMVIQGVAAAGLGRGEEGVEQTERGIAMYENIQTPPIFWPQILGLRAQASALAGRSADALDLFDQAIAVAIPGSFDTAALQTFKAMLLLTAGDVERAEPLLRRGLEEARAIGMRMIELVAATWLAQIAMAKNGGAEIAALREVYETFTEGFENPYLIEARDVLDQARAADA